jgi:hypothetical protein
LCFSNNQFELEKYGSTVLSALENTFLFAIPVVIFIVGKIRGKIGKNINHMKAMEVNFSHAAEKV